MKLKLLLILAITLIACKEKNTSTAEAVDNEAIDSENLEQEQITETPDQTDDLEVYDFNGLKPFLNKKDDKVHVINFWATWCGPCVKELPYFEKLNEVYAEKNVEVILVSLDFPHLYDSKLKPFIKEENLKSKVIALDDVDMNTWIPQIDSTWSGSIPATLIYKNDDFKFFEQSFTYDELEKEVKLILN